MALELLTKRIAPQTLLARVQGVWNDVAGEVVAEESAPVSERAGTITVACRSAVWAQELQMLAPDLSERLNEALGGSAEQPFITGLKFVYESPARRG